MIKMWASKSENVYKLNTMVWFIVAQTMYFIYIKKFLYWIYGFYLLSPGTFHLNGYVFLFLLIDFCFLSKINHNQNMCAFYLCHIIDNYILDVHLCFFSFELLS